MIEYAALRCFGEEDRTMNRNVAFALSVAAFVGILGTLNELAVANQQDVISELQKRGALVYVVDDREGGKAIEVDFNGEMKLNDADLKLVALLSNIRRLNV